MTVAVLAEKPSVARDVAQVLGATTRKPGYFEGSGYIVTWALGHLVTLPQPHEILPQWKTWSLATLPMLPDRFPLVVVPETQEQFSIIKQIFRSRAVERIICATDAGREGELIFRYIYEATGCKKNVHRLWISSLVPESIEEGFRTLRDLGDYDGLADAARGRSIADWLVGMNLSRAYALTLNEEISVGRVQTPTLAMVVERELSIRAFVPEDYFEVVATFTLSPTFRLTPATYRGVWFRVLNEKNRSGKTLLDKHRLNKDDREAKAIVDRVRSGNAKIASVHSEKRRVPPPFLYDLTELQRHANRLYGMSAQRTLDLAQSLYEKHKLVSYPRTDSRHLSENVSAHLPEVLRVIAPRYGEAVAKDSEIRRLGKRFVDDTRVSDHHAIIPTHRRVLDSELSFDENRVYDLICRRLLQAWHEDHEYSTTTIITEVTSSLSPTSVDRFESRGTVVDRLGWKLLEIGGNRSPMKTLRRSPKEDEESDSNDDSQELPLGLTKGDCPKVVDCKPVAKRTRPPKRLTEATLLTAMESAGNALDEKDLSDAMRERGLGTPATRAQIIETLLRREYIHRIGKNLQATEKGINLVEVVHEQVKTPIMTGEWEYQLKLLQTGKGSLKAFITSIEQYVSRVVDEIKAKRPQVTLPSDSPENADPRRKPFPQKTLATKTPFTESSRPGLSQQTSSTSPTASTTARRLPTAPEQLKKLLQSAFGFPEFRPHQQTVCQTITSGQDALLVMPTGAGKSLCYQLPGIARAGTTLVISPLIALMDDQASKLSQQGFVAERLHSGRSRTDSRQICIDYLKGKLDFLFIAPERLKVPGFPELLAKRTPSLIAVDEAHCISQWGHDFRPDYRLVGQRLKPLKNSPLIALTATATPRVQDDIIAQLELRNPARFIHGFRRSNLAITVVPSPPKERVKTIVDLLSSSTRRPAIVYAATRKNAEVIGAALGKRHAAIYHAGIEPEERERVQTAFLTGTIDVIVATVAFGMGIDKANVRTVIHAALPGSVEGYYQEIGRAGRDGNVASAILIYSFVDRKTHDFFLERDYPDVSLLSAIDEKLTKTPVAIDKLRKKVKIPKDSFERALDQLLIHGGAVKSADDEFVKGPVNWQISYLAQRDHKVEQLEKMVHFTQSTGCRMIELVSHFGDREDTGQKCGLCDICSPNSAVIIPPRPAAIDKSDLSTKRRILAALSKVDGLATGKLFLDVTASKSIPRRVFEGELKRLCDSNLIFVRETTFEKDGKTITYRRAELTEEGRKKGATSAPLESDNEFGNGDGKAKVVRKTKKKPKARKSGSVSKDKWFFINRAKRRKKV